MSECVCVCVCMAWFVKFVEMYDNVFFLKLFVQCSELNPELENIVL